MTQKVCGVHLGRLRTARCRHTDGCCPCPRHRTPWIARPRGGRCSSPRLSDSCSELLAAVVLVLARKIYHEPYLPSALAIATLALATRALHLDGLADTADGLGVGAHRGRERALAVMRAGDIGPFGVVTVVLVLLVQVTALSDAVLHGLGTESVVGAAIIGRLAATHACLRRRARRPSLTASGATVAGSVGRLGAAIVTAVVLAGGLLEGGVLDDDAGTRPAPACRARRHGRACRRLAGRRHRTPEVRRRDRRRPRCGRRDRDRRRPARPRGVALGAVSRADRHASQRHGITLRSHRSVRGNPNPGGSDERPTQSRAAAPTAGR